MGFYREFPGHCPCSHAPFLAEFDLKTLTDLASSLPAGLGQVNTILHFSSSLYITGGNSGVVEPVQFALLKG